MKTLLIVFHSLTGGTRQMAEAACAGAMSLDLPSEGQASQDGASHGATPHESTCESPIRVRMVTAPEAGTSDLLDADGYIFATPENLAAMAGRMKDFFDRTYYPVLDRINGRPYATLICAGSDGENAARQIARIATGWRLRVVAAPLIICTKAQTPETILAAKTIARADLDRCRELGATLAAGLEAGIF